MNWMHKVALIITLSMVLAACQTTKLKCTTWSGPQGDLTECT